VPLVLDQVGYTYSSHEGRLEALKDLSLTLADGSFLGIIGHTGSGKSTLLQLMCGLLTPTSGSILLDGLDISQKNIRRRLHSEVGMAFQYPEYQLFASTVAEDVGFAAGNAGLDAAEIDARVRLAMQRVHLDFDRYATLSPFDLSGGEKRRVALAGVIATEPRILILDEPAAGLDPAGRREILGIIEQFHRFGMTIVMVSHDMDDIASLATQILVLKDGREVLAGTPAEVFAHADQLRAINLGVPRSEAYATTLREAGLPLTPGLLSIEALADALAELVVDAPAQSIGGQSHGL
jgi:energy-coupling factor transport system ATP-binding protein